MITISTCAAMSLLYVLFAKFVPIISVWELKVGGHDAPPVRAEDVDEAQELWRAHP
jgi:hypothetical protein